jgi:hypothetical protein
VLVLKINKVIYAYNFFNEKRVLTFKIVIELIERYAVKDRSIGEINLRIFSLLALTPLLNRLVRPSLRAFSYLFY